MDEFETRLRDGLTALAEPVRPTVVAEALFAPGERRRARRRLTAVAGGAVAVLVIGLGLGAMPGLRGIPPVVVATPSPIATASATPTTLPSQSPHGGNVDLKLISHGVIDRVDIMTEQTPRGLKLRLTMIGTNGLVLHSWTGEATPSERFEVSADYGVKLRIGVLAHEVADLNLISGNPLPRSLRWTYQLIPGGEGTVYYAMADDGGDPDIADVLWRSPSGDYFDATGKRLTSARVKLAGYSGWVYLDSARSVVRYQLGEWENRLNLGGSELDCHSSSDTDDNGTTTAFEICLLPKGATGITPALGAGGEHWETYGLEDWTVLLVTGSSLDSSTLIRSVTYHQPGGAKVVENLP